MRVEGNPFRPAAPEEVIGFIREPTANGPIDIWGAEVEIVGGERDGFKQTSISGFFRIGGLRTPGFELLVREAGYSTRRFRVNELGRDLSSDTVMTPAPTMVSDVLEGGVCCPTRTISTRFTPTMAGFLRITSSRYVSTLREVYEDGILIKSHLTNNTDLQTRIGVRYELRVTGSCDYDPSSNVQLTFLRPR